MTMSRTHLSTAVWRRLAWALALSALLHVGFVHVVELPGFLPAFASNAGVPLLRVRLLPEPDGRVAAQDPGMHTDELVPTRLANTASLKRLAVSDARQPGPQTFPATQDEEIAVALTSAQQLVPLGILNLNYPVSYRGMAISAHVVLDIELASDGRVSSLRIVEVFPQQYSDFGQAALDAFSGARFAVNTGPRQAAYRVRVEFTPETAPFPQ